MFRRQAFEGSHRHEEGEDTIEPTEVSAAVLKEEVADSAGTTEEAPDGERHSQAVVQGEKHSQAVVQGERHSQADKQEAAKPASPRAAPAKDPHHIDFSIRKGEQDEAQYKHDYKKAAHLHHEHDTNAMPAYDKRMDELHFTNEDRLGTTKNDLVHVNEVGMGPGFGEGQFYGQYIPHGVTNANVGPGPRSVVMAAYKDQLSDEQRDWIAQGFWDGSIKLNKNMEMLIDKLIQTNRPSVVKGYLKSIFVRHNPKVFAIGTAFYGGALYATPTLFAEAREAAVEYREIRRGWWGASNEDLVHVYVECAKFVVSFVMTYVFWRSLKSSVYEDWIANEGGLGQWDYLDNLDEAPVTGGDDLNDDFAIELVEREQALKAGLKEDEAEEMIAERGRMRAKGGKISAKDLASQKQKLKKPSKQSDMSDNKLRKRKGDDKLPDDDESDPGVTVQVTVKVPTGKSSTSGKEHTAVLNTSAKSSPKGKNLRAASPTNGATNEEAKPVQPLRSLSPKVKKRDDVDDTATAAASPVLLSALQAGSPPAKKSSMCCCPGGEEEDEEYEVGDKVLYYTSGGDWVCATVDKVGQNGKKLNLLRPDGSVLKKGAIIESVRRFDGPKNAFK